MAGGYSSRWVTLGAEADNSVNSGTDSSFTEGIAITSFLPNTSVIKTTTGASGIDAYVRHECDMWLVDGADTGTAPFNWMIDGDMTIVFDGTGTDMAANSATVAVEMQGSVDGAHWINMVDIGDWVTGGTSTVAGHLVYDFDTNGKMPYMRLKLDAGGTGNNQNTPFKINIFMHSV
jgi:hypothetical protein